MRKGAAIVTCGVMGPFCFCFAFTRVFVNTAFRTDVTHDGKKEIGIKRSLFSVLGLSTEGFGLIFRKICAYYNL